MAKNTTSARYGVLPGGALTGGELSPPVLPGTRGPGANYDGIRLKSHLFRPLISHDPARPRGSAPHRAVAFIGTIFLTLAFPVVQCAWAEKPCPIPEALELRGISLPIARQEVTANRRLIILTFGGTRPPGIDAEILSGTYPARLESALRAALPGIEVTVRNVAPPGRTSADVSAALPDLITKTGAKLVIWGPGGRDVMAHLGIDEFRDAVNTGIEAARGNGADLILLDTTFVPSPARMAAIEIYRDRLLAAALANHVPLLRRHAMMRQWSEDGTLDLGARGPAEQELVARQLFSCVAQGLAVPIAAAVR